jgi:hypothetical protein
LVSTLEVVKTYRYIYHGLEGFKQSSLISIWACYRVYDSSRVFWCCEINR